MMMQGHRVDGGIQPAGRQQCLAGRGEADTLARETVIQRLDAESVARQEQLLPAAVPDREGEHAVQAGRTVLAPLGIRPENDLGIAVGNEMMTERLQLLAQFRVVVDGAIEDQCESGRVIAHGLRGTFRQVDDRQSPVSQRDRAVEPGAAAVRSAPRERIRHPAEHAPVRRLSVKAQLTADSAHRL